jgi:hypothetical protein
LAAPAQARFRFDPTDQVDIAVVDHKLIAVVGVGFAAVEERLGLGEQVLAVRSRGFVGVVSTNRRLLAISSRSNIFAELRYRVSEGNIGEDALHVGDRLALVELPTRIVAFTPFGGGWFELSLGPGETPRRVEAEADVAAVVTPRRAIAFSPRLRSFVQFPLTPDEDVERASLSDESITLILPHRILVFRDGDEFWTSVNR